MVQDQVDAWAKVQLARRSDRPKPQHIVPMLIDNLLELHGDRFAGDDETMLAGIGTLEGLPVTVIATRRGHDLESNLRYRFGMPQPEGYRKALRLMKQAEKFSRPVLLFIDTPGAYPGIDSEDRGISSAIANNLAQMSALRVPLIAVVTGEGGSGGALALMVADRICMLENAVLSVISPEGCASILFKDASAAPQAARHLGLDCETLDCLGIVDHVIPEGEGLHVESTAALAKLKEILRQELKALTSLHVDTMLEARYQKFRHMGMLGERTGQA